MLLRAAALALSAAAARGDMYDVVEPSMAPPPACALGCARWSDLASSHNTAAQASVDALWASSDAQRAAGASCAMPALFAGQPEGEAQLAGASGEPLGFDFSFGPQCYCAGSAAAPTSASGYCADPLVPTPQQVNLQFGASEHELSVAFVTLDGARPLVSPPLVELCNGAGAQCVNVSGATTRMPEPQLLSRVYSFHLVTLPAPLAPGASFSYRVRGGTADGAWRGGFSFTTRPAAAAPTRFATCGDLGPYPYASNGNLLGDASLSFFVHLGDHAYNMAMGGGARGDAYMISFQPVLSRTPWLSVVGSAFGLSRTRQSAAHHLPTHAHPLRSRRPADHELEGSPFGAYCRASDHCEYRYTNQTSGLLRTGAASRSGTNLFYSIDIGLVHFVVLDYNSYIGLPGSPKAPMLAWLEADLQAAAAAAQRARVPWIIVCAHVPMYASDGNNDELIKDVEPLLFEFGVDLHLVGHNHYYESEWPVGPNGAVAKKSFDSPQAPVHVVTGAGGAPAFGATAPAAAGGAAPPDFTRLNVYRWSFSAVTVFNASHLLYEQIDNSNSSAIDSFVVVQPKHGKFGGGGAASA